MRKRLRHLPAALATTGVLLVAAMIVGWLWRGGTGAAGAAAGVGLVAASFVISSVAIAWADSVHPRLVMSVGLVTYSLKVIIIGVVMASIAATEWRGLPAMGIAVIVTALVWITAQAVWVWRAKIPYVEIDEASK
jgi:ATP synthase protein I